MNVSPEQCATELLDTVPMLMRVIRAKVQASRGSDLSIPQFRTLAFIGRGDGVSLSDVATHLGLTLPTASKLVEGLVAAKLATRKTHAGDRRYVVLALTRAGRKRHGIARAEARDFFTEKFAELDEKKRREIFRATQILKEISSVSTTSGVLKKRNAAAKVSR